MLAAKEKRELRQIAHHLQVIVTVGDSGVSDGVRAETDRALTDHELIKMRVNIGERDERRQLAAELAESVNAQVVHSIGKVFVLFRENPKANPLLSNRTRFAK